MEEFKPGEQVYVWLEDDSHKAVFVAREGNMIIVSIPGVGEVKVDHKDVLSAWDYAEYSGEMEDAKSFREDWNRLADSGKCSRRCSLFGGVGGCLWLREGEDFCGNYEPREVD